MTADESGLPPLAPGDLAVPEFRPANALLGWLVRTVTDLDISENQRAELANLLRDIRFQEMAVSLESDLMEQIQERLTAELGKDDLPPVELPSDEELDATYEWLLKPDEPTEGESPG